MPFLQRRADPRLPSIVQREASPERKTDMRGLSFEAHLMIDADPRNAPSHEEEVRQHQQPREILLDEEQIDEDEEKVDDD